MFCSDKLTQSYDSESFEPQLGFSSPGACGTTGPILGIKASLLGTSFELRDNRRPISPEKLPFCYDLISLNSPTHITPKGFPLFISIQNSSSKPQNYVSTSPFCGLDVEHGTGSTRVPLFSMPTSKHSLKPDYLSEFDPLCRTSAFESSFGHPMSNVDGNQTPWSACAGSPFTESIVSNPEQSRGSVGITSANIGVLAPSLSQNTTRADYIGNETPILYSGSRGMVPTFPSEDAYSTPPMPCHDVAYGNEIQANFRESVLHYPTKALHFYQGKSATNFGFTTAPGPRVMQQDPTPFVPLSSSGNWTPTELNADSMPRIHACQSLAQFSSLPSNPRSRSDGNWKRASDFNRKAEMKDDCMKSFIHSHQSSTKFNNLLPSISGTSKDGNSIGAGNFDLHAQEINADRTKPWTLDHYQSSTLFNSLSSNFRGLNNGNCTESPDSALKSAEINSEDAKRSVNVRHPTLLQLKSLNSKTLSHCSTQVRSRSDMPLEQRNGFPLLGQPRLGSKNSHSHTTFTKSKATFQDCFENETNSENVPAPMEDSSLKELTSSSSFKRFRYFDLDEGLFTPFMTTAPKTESEKQQKYKEDPLYRHEEDSLSRCTSSSVCPSKTSRKTYAECNQANVPSTSVASSAVEILFDSLNGRRILTQGQLSSLISKSEMSKSPKNSNQAQSGTRSSTSQSTAAEGSHTETEQQNISSTAVQSEHPRVIENSKLLKSPVPRSSDGLDSKSSPKYRRITENDCSTNHVHVSSLRATESENSQKSTIPVPASKKKRCKRHLNFDAVGSLFSPPNYTESTSIPLDNEKHTIAAKEKCLVKLVVSTTQQSETSAVGAKSLQVHASTSSSNESEPSEIRPQSSPTCVTARQDQRSKLHELCTWLPLKPQSTFPRNDVSEQCKSPALRDAGELPATSKYNQDELPKSDLQSRTIPKSSLLVSKKKSRFIAPSIDDDFRDGFNSNVNAKVETSDAKKSEKCAWVQKDDPVLHYSHQKNISPPIGSKILMSSDVFDATESPDDDVEASLRCRELLHPRKRPAAKELLGKPNKKFTQFSTEEKRCPSADSKLLSSDGMSKKEGKNFVGALAKISTAKEPSDDVIHSEVENSRSLSLVLVDCQTTSYKENGEDGEDKLQANIRSSQEQCYPSHLPRPEKQTPKAVQQPGEKIKFVDEK